jgi:IS605 OrfB family transposase
MCRWPTYFDLTGLTSGCPAELGIHSDTVAAVCRAFVTARDAHRRCPRWRTGRKNLDWIPNRNAGRNVRLVPDGMIFRKRRYRLWWSRNLPTDGEVKTAAFGCDARGRWYVSLVVKTNEARPHGSGVVGIDLGLKTLAVTSDGEAIANLRHTARYAARLGVAQRAGNKHRVVAINAKIANSRRDHLHKVSTHLMRANRRIIVGNVSSANLAKTKMAKSVLDAGWSAFRSMLAYKAIAHQVEYAEVNEAYTSQVCSECGALPTSRPKGIADLGMRAWECSECGAVHDRDHNAAKNILRLGLARQPLVEGIAA